MRLRNYGKWIYDRPEKTISSNPLKSISGGPFSPIPKGLMDQMAAMKISKQGTKNHGINACNNKAQQPSTHFSTPPQKTEHMIQKISWGNDVITTTQHNGQVAATKVMKRKLGSAGNIEAHMDTDEEELVGLVNKANQQI